MKVVCLFVVLIGALDAAINSTDVVVCIGGEVEIKCESFCGNCNYYYQETALYFQKQFGSQTRRLWSLNGGFDYPNEFGERLTISQNGYNFTVNITNLQIGDAGVYTCRNNGMDNLARNLVVIGTEVKLSIDNSSDIYVTNSKTCLANCSFDISSHQWGNDYPRLELMGASETINVLKYNFTVVKTFKLSVQRSQMFKCKVFLSNSSAPMESKFLSVVLKEPNVKDETFVATSGGNVLLSCLTPVPTNKRWMWFAEGLYQVDEITFPIVECTVGTSKGCRNASKTSSFEYVSALSYSFLSFVAIGHESSGTYTCIDDVFTVRKSFNLIVVGEAPSEMRINGTFVQNNGTVEMVKDKLSIISCSILSPSDGKKYDAHHPKLVVENAEFMNYTRNGSYLVYYYKAFINESRSYTCFIEIQKGMQVVNEIQNYTINFKVFYCPQQLVILSDAKNGSIERGSVLSCRTSAVPPVDLIWTSENMTLKSDNGPNYADLRVYGKMHYTCQSIQKHHKVLGMCKTLMVSLEFDQVESRRYEEIKKPVRLGRSLTLGCASHYNRNNNWKWIRDWYPNATIPNAIVDCAIEENLNCANISTNKRILDHSVRSFTSLMFPETDIEDSGTYSCVDSVRTVVKTFRVDVFACPFGLLTTRTNQPDGSSELTCKVNAIPPVSLIWTLSGNITALSTGLNNVKVKVNKNGAYKCFVPSSAHPFLGTCGELSITYIIDNY